MSKVNREKNINALIFVLEGTVVERLSDEAVVIETDLSDKDVSFVRWNTSIDCRIIPA